MVSSGSLLVVTVGRGAGLLLFGAGGAHIVSAFPPPMLDVMYALFFFLAAFVPLTIAEFIAFDLAVLRNLPKDSSGLVEAKKVRLETFAGIRDAATSLKNMYQTVVRPVSKPPR
jgi:hypothetical protein